MKIYGYSQRLRPKPFHTSLKGQRDLNHVNATSAPLLIAIAKMWKGGFLPDDASVWFNADYPELGMWVLAEESTHVQFHESLVDLWARINRTSVRLATTWNNTTIRPLREFRVGDTGLADIHSTIVVSQHTAGDTPERVRFAANSDIVKPVNGKVTFDPFTVVDLNYHKGPDEASTNPLVSADALLNGTRLMTYGAEDDQVQLVHDNLDAFCSEVDPKKLTIASGVDRQELGVAYGMFSKQVIENLIGVMDKNTLSQRPVDGGSEAS